MNESENKQLLADVALLKEVVAAQKLHIALLLAFAGGKGKPWPHIGQTEIDRLSDMNLSDQEKSQLLELFHRYFD